MRIAKPGKIGDLAAYDGENDEDKTFAHADDGERCRAARGRRVAVGDVEFDRIEISPQELVQQDEGDGPEILNPCDGEKSGADHDGQHESRAQANFLFNRVREISSERAKNSRYGGEDAEILNA